MKAATIHESTQAALDQAIELARQQKQKTTIEHALRCLVDVPSLVPVWAALEVDAQALGAALQAFTLPHPLATVPTEAHGALTSGLDRVIRRAMARNSLAGASVMPLDLLVSIADEREAEGTRYLAQHGATLERLISCRGGQSIASLSPAASPSAAPAPAGKVFISYAHEDAGHLERLRVHLKPLERAGRLASWSDQQIRTGDQWRAEIRRNLDDASIAILLISADFLASDFIDGDELPPLLLAANQRGLRILPVVVSACAYPHDDSLQLSIYQAVNADRPLIDQPKGVQEGIWDKVRQEVSTALKAPRT